MANSVSEELARVKELINEGKFEIALSRIKEKLLSEALNI